MNINELIFDRLNNENKTNNDVPKGWFLETVEANFVDKECASIALKNIIELMTIFSIVKNNRKDWPTVNEWKDILPQSLLVFFRPEYSKEEIEEMLKNKQPRSGWSLEDWEFYMKNKVWEWWAGKVKDNKLEIEILVDGHPFSIYELKTLLELFGASSVKLN